MLATENGRIRSRVALYAGRDLRALLHDVEEAVRDGLLPVDALSVLGDVVTSIAGELQRRELLLADALEEQRYHSIRLAETGKETDAYWYAQRDVASRRSALLSAAAQANLVTAELEALLARAAVRRARTIPSNPPTGATQ